MAATLRLIKIFLSSLGNSYPVILKWVHYILRIHQYLKILDYYRVSIYLIIYHMKYSKPLIPWWSYCKNSKKSNPYTLWQYNCSMTFSKTWEWYFNSKKCDTNCRSLLPLIMDKLRFSIDNLFCKVSVRKLRVILLAKPLDS